MNFDQLVQAFLSIGIQKGDVLALHSSLSSLGNVEGGADTVIEALQEVVTEKGTLLMPTHSGNLSCYMNVGYHPAKSGCKEITGIIPDTFWRKEGVLRSKHPSHSTAAWGNQAHWFLEHHSPATYAFEKNTPFHKVAMAGGKILLLGVKNTRNSSIHVSEYLADASYLNVSYSVPEGTTYLVENEDGSITKYPLTGILPGCSKNFDWFDPILFEAQAMKRCKIGSSDSYLIDSDLMMKTIIPYIKKQPETVLCHHSDCSCCANRRKLMGIDSKEIEISIIAS